MFTLIGVVVVGAAGWILYADRAALVADMKKDFAALVTAAEAINVTSVEAKVKTDIAAVVAKIKAYL